GVGQQVVGDDVQLLLLFVLHVDGARRAQGADQGAARHHLTDLDAGGGRRRQRRDQSLRQVEGGEVGGEIGAGGHDVLQILWAKRGSAPHGPSDRRRQVRRRLTLRWIHGLRSNALAGEIGSVRGARSR